MKMFTLIADAVIILTLAIIVLAIFAVLRRYLSDLSEARIRRLRQRMQCSLDDFVAGKADVQTVIRELGSDHGIALGVLIDTASRLPREERMLLRALFEQFRFAQKETAALRSRRWPIRMRAATRLGYMSLDSAIPELVKALEDDILDVRLAAAHALAQLGAIKAVRPILHALALPAAWPLRRSAEILYEMGSDAIEPLVSLLGEKGPQSQEPAVAVAIRVLGMLRANRAAAPVSGFLRSPDPELRLCSAKTLGQMGDPQAVAALCTALEDPVWEVRSAAAQSLGRFGRPAAIPGLGKVLADPAWWVRFNAAESLYRLGPEGQEVLKTAAAEHPDNFARDISRQILDERGAIPTQEALRT